LYKTHMTCFACECNGGARTQIAGIDNPQQRI
jgi:hypothetical protein